MKTLLLPILIGWVFGYVVNYLADVLPVARRFVPPFCPSCETAFSLREYVLGAACRQCGKRRSVRFWVVLAAMIISSIYIWVHPPPRLGFPLGLALLTYFALV